MLGKARKVKMPEIAPQRFCLEDFPHREPGPQPLSVDPLDPLDIKSGQNLWSLCRTVEELIGAKEATIAPEMRKTARIFISCPVSRRSSTSAALTRLVDACMGY